MSLELTPAKGNKKTGLPTPRQPGYLLKTRGFPPPPRDGFGFLLRFKDKHH